MEKFESEDKGYRREQVDYYIKQLEAEFQTIIKGQSEKLENVRHNVGELAKYSQVVPVYKSEIESLRERLENVKDFANRASEQRYLKGQNIEVLLANLITQILTETNDIDKQKPLKTSSKAAGNRGEDFFEVLASTKELKLDEALEGFEFYEQNPYKSKAEKKLAKMEAKRTRKARA